MPDLKAVSQNLMHSSLQVTDSIYSVLSEEDVERRIQELGTRQLSGAGSATDELANQLQNIVNQLKAH